MRVKCQSIAFHTRNGIIERGHCEFHGAESVASMFSAFNLELIDAFDFIGCFKYRNDMCKFCRILLRFILQNLSETLIH